MICFGIFLFSTTTLLLMSCEHPVPSILDVERAFVVHYDPDQHLHMIKMAGGYSPRFDAFCMYLIGSISYLIECYLGTIVFLSHTTDVNLTYVADSIIWLSIVLLGMCIASLYCHLAYWFALRVLRLVSAFLKPVRFCVSFALGWTVIPLLNYFSNSFYYWCSKEFSNPITLPSRLVNIGGSHMLQTSHLGETLYVKLNPLLTLVTDMKSSLGLECAIQSSPFLSTTSTRSTVALCDSNGTFHGCMFRFRTSQNTYLATAYHVFETLGRDNLYVIVKGRVMKFPPPTVIASSAQLDFVVFSDSHMLHFAGAKVAKGSKYENAMRVTTHGTCDGTNWFTAKGPSKTLEAPYFSHAASTGSGFSGSPLFNDKDLVIGMHLKSELIDGKPTNVGIDLVHILSALERISKQTRLESAEPGDDSSAWFERGEEVARDFFRSGKQYSDIEYYGTAYEYLAREDKYALNEYFKEMSAGGNYDEMDADYEGVGDAYRAWGTGTNKSYHQGTFYGNENAIEGSQDFRNGLGITVTQPPIPLSCASVLRPHRSSLSSAVISSSDLIPLSTPIPMVSSVTLESAIPHRVALPSLTPALPIIGFQKPKSGTGRTEAQKVSLPPLPTKLPVLTSQEKRLRSRQRKSLLRKQNSNSS